MSDEMRIALDSLGIRYTDDQVSSLERYLSEIELWNPVYKLIAADHEGIIYRHIIDSLAPVKILQGLVSELDAPHAADLGSGNGMPGIPLSIMLPDTPFTLVERSGRRVGFLRNALASAGLSKRVSLIESDIMEVTDQFDLLLFRAFRPLPEVFSGLDRMLNPGGAMFAYKGQLSSVKGELQEIEELIEGRYTVDIRPYEVPGLDAERAIVILKKQ